MTADSWTSDSTYTKYSYKCTIPLSGITTLDYAEIVLGVTEATSNNYAPICETYDGGVYIWSKVNDTITIPAIVVGVF